MKNYTEEEVVSLIERFEKQKLPKEEWTHEAHLVVGVWYASKYDFETGMNYLRDLITRHNESVGTPNSETEGYHETITRFWLMVTKKFLADKQSLLISEACNVLINSPEGHSHYPLHFYSRGQLFSHEARHSYVNPDLKSLD